MNGKRLDYLDYAKGIGLLLVIIGHCISNEIRRDSSVASTLYKGIYFFHMELMFFLSGKTFAISVERHKNTPFFRYLKSRFEGYMIPYFCYAVTVKVVFILASCIPAVKKMLDNTSFTSDASFLYGVFTASNPLSLHIWYLYVLFFMVVISFAVLKAFKCKYNTLCKIVLLIISIVLSLGNTKYLYDVWFGAFMFMSMYFWFCLGMVIDIKQVNLPVIFIGALIIVVANYTAIDGKVFLLMIEVLERLVIIAIITKLCLWLENKKILTKLRELGKDSMIYYIFHQPFCAAFASIIIYRVINNYWGLATISAFVLSLLVPRFLKFVIEKYDLRSIRKIYLGK